MDRIEGKVTRVGTRKPNGWAPFWVDAREADGTVRSVKMTGVARHLEAGDWFSASGTWNRRSFQDRSGRTRSEDQFKIASIRPELPTGKQEAVDFLASVFDVRNHGISQKALQSLIDAEGVSAVERLERDPEVAVALSRDPEQFRKRIVQDWQSRFANRRAVALMEEAGLEPHAIDRVLSVFQDEVMRVLERNPYDIMGVPDVEFAEADRVGRALGFESDDERRVASALKASVERKALRDGNTYARLLKDGVLAEIKSLLDDGTDGMVRFVQSVLKNGHPTLHFEPDGGSDFIVSPRDLARKENEIAEGVVKRVRRGQRRDPDAVAKAVDAAAKASGIPFDATQKESAAMALREPVSVLTGGPGTGKSAVQGLVASLARKMDGTVHLAAPTGTAAARLSEAVADEGVDLKASTVHRLLEGYPDGKGGNVFRRNADNKLEGPCLVVIDETSMLDTDLLHAVLDALPENGRLLLVGDRYQLPSVGPGAVLRDLVECGGVPFSELTEVYRQKKDSAIAHGAAQIRQGNVPHGDLRRKVRGGLAFFECDTEHIEPSIETLVAGQLAERGYDPMSDVCVLTPERRAVAGVNSLNRKLGNAINTGADESFESGAAKQNRLRAPTPRIGDRVMFRDNDVEKDVYNGDTGTLLEMGEGRDAKMKVAFDNGSEIEFPANRYRSFDVAYATTVHKSQGQQYPVVVLPVSERHGMLDRALLYTGWTRAKGLLLLVGSRDALDVAVANTKSYERKTRLGRLLERGFGLSPAKSPQQPKSRTPTADEPVGIGFGPL